MSISLSSAAPSTTKVDWLIVPIAKSRELSLQVQAVNEAMSGAVQALIDREDFDPKPEQATVILQASGVAAANVVLVGVGAIESCGVRCLRRSLVTALRSCCSNADQSVAIVLDEFLLAQHNLTQLLELTADCVTAAPHGGDLYKKERGRHRIAKALLIASDSNANDPESNAAIERGVVIAEACNLVKDLVNRHPDDLHPESFANEADSLAGELGLEVLILDERALRSERMESMLAVAKGSSRAPRMVKLTYRGAGDDEPTTALVGKGVTFDSGGYSIKPSAGMISMKADMAGAATALGAIVAAARLKLPVNVSVYLGLVENMISGNAYRLGDVLTARNGTTIEVHNTDAEGRLVLADVLSYAADDGVSHMVDLATLTGACVVALGEEITGVFAGDEALGDDLCAAAQVAGEFFWPMPMHDHFGPQLKSSFADCKNIGPRWGGAVTAAKFLQKFVGETPWVHLDIAGPSWADSGSEYQDAGGTADPVRSLIQWLGARSSQTSQTTA